MADIFAVVADPTRRDLLRILHTRSLPAAGATGELSVSELVAELGLSQPTVSKHLRVLRDAGLVSVREKGQHRFYRLQAAPLYAVEEWLRPFGGTTVPPTAHEAREAGSLAGDGNAAGGGPVSGASTGAGNSSRAADDTASTAGRDTATGSTAVTATGIGASGSALAATLGRLAADISSRVGWIAGSRTDTPR